MSDDPFFSSLEYFLKSSGRPLRLGIFYTGGTFACVENTKSGKRSPMDNPADVESLLLDGTNLRDFHDFGLLEAKLTFVEALDSSQMKQAQRDLITQAINPEYSWFDGAIVIHGTDTGANTATDLHFSFPYFNPVDLAIGRQTFNATKPIVVLSSQIPVAYSIKDGKETNKKTLYRMSLASDGPMNLAVGIMGIAHQRVGEAGIITNHLELYRGTTSHKGNENDIPPYMSDSAIDNLAIHTGVGLRYTTQGFLQCQKLEGTPFALTNKSSHEDEVILVKEGVPLSLIYDKQRSQSISAKILLYETTGQGHVHEDDVPLLQNIQREGIEVYRVPLPGGRIPPGGSAYDVPGHEFTALNMQAATARAKGVAVLSLSDYTGKKDSQFITDMMKKSWGAEFLPNR
jgi:L-asparaginase/Glu-tRNA(Gln) amidotransferase subunit D